MGRQRDPNGGEPGRVILLNGSPSAGKTTIARALWAELEPPHWYRSIDDFREGYLVRHWDEGPRPKWDDLVSGFVRSVAEMAWAGHHVITESVILPRWVDTYLDAFDGLTVVLVGVRCPLGVAQERERRRTDRRGGPIDLAVPDFDALHRDVSYDVDFDTSVTPIADAVRLIRDQLRSPATAFDVLRARRATST
jgi:chloramphenicol 3-O phosphotransferase